VSWLNSFFIGVLTALLAGTAGGLVAVKCVGWYNISSREGASGYFVISIVLLSAFISFIAGVVISRYVTGFLPGFGIASGSILGLAGVIAGFAWGLADLPPTINGHDLNLVIEARLPKGAQKPPVLEGKQFVWFESVPRFGPSRASRSGALETANARFEDGRWVVPGSVHIFTTRNSRRVAIALDDKTATGFELNFPGHPGPKYKQWSQWLPGTEVPNWPDSNMSYRFRIEEIIPVVTPPAPDPFKALTSESPLREWLRYFDGFGRQPEIYQAIMKQVTSRPGDLADVLRSSNDEDFRQALNAVYQLSAYDPQVVQAMLDVAADFAGQIRRFNAMAPQEPGTEELGVRIRDRFTHWGNTWMVMQRKIHSDGSAPVEAILKLARVRADSPTMKVVAESARYILSDLKQ
jgi:hypothetical protein